MFRSTFKPLETLIEGANRINTNYEEAIKKRKGDPARLVLKHEFNVLIKLIIDLKDTNQFKEENLSALYEGALVYVQNDIDETYDWLNPDYKPLILNWGVGSRLYHEVSVELGHLTDKEKFCRLGKLYNFIFNQPQPELQIIFNNTFNENNIDQSVLKTKMHDLIINNLENHTKQLPKLIPPEMAIKKNIDNFLYNYIKKSLIEQNRLPDFNVIFFLKVIMAINKMLGSLQKHEDSKNFLSMSQRRLMGILLADMKSIYNSYYYYLLSPDNRSVRYKLYQETLNINKVEDIDKETQLACFEAVKNMKIDLEKLENLVNTIQIEDCLAKLKLDKDITNLEETKRTAVYQLLDKFSQQLNATKPCYYVDHEILKIKEQNSAMLNDFEASYLPSAAKLLAVISGIAGFVPGCAIGSMAGQGFGKIISNAPFFLPAKKAVNYAMGVMIGDSTQGYVGYYLADEIVNVTLQRGFSVVFGALAALGLGGASGGLTLMLSDLTYQTLKGVCYYYLGENSKTKQGKSEDLEFIECLLSLPPDIFADDKKNKVKYNNPGRFFSYSYNRNTEPQVEEIPEENQIEQFTLI